MNKVIGLLIVIAVVIGVGPYARSLSAPPVPPGISADNWIALGDTAGFVITNGDSLIGSTSSVGVARGYFMLRRGGNWLRVDSTPN
jgi:hypothetical protein